MCLRKFNVLKYTRESYTKNYMYKQLYLKSLLNINLL